MLVLSAILVQWPSSPCIVVVGAFPLYLCILESHLSLVVLAGSLGCSNVIVELSELQMHSGVPAMLSETPSRDQSSWPFFYLQLSLRPLLSYRSGI